MATPTPATLPSTRITIEWPADTPWSDDADDAFNAAANDQIIAKAAELIVAGERPWMEVFYRGVPGKPDTTEADFDAVEVVDGTIVTLPPYSELEG